MPPWDRYSQPQQQSGVVFADPYRAAEEQRKSAEEIRRDQDQQFEAARLRDAERDSARADEAADIAARKDAREAAEWSARFNPDGTPKAAASAGALTAEMRGAAMSQYGTLGNLAAGANDLRQQYNDNFKGENPFEGIGASLPFMRPADRVFNDRSGSLTAFIATALGLSGQQFNTPAEQQLFIGSILPKASDTDVQIEAKLNTLDELIGNARQMGRAKLGYTDDNDPLAANSDFTDFLNRQGGSPIPPPGAAGGGATNESLPIPPEMQQAHAAYLAENWGRLTPEGYSAFRQGLDRQFNFEPRPEAYAAIVPDLNARAAGGGTPQGLNIGPVNQEMTEFDQLRNDAVSNPVGAFAASMGNAGGFGIPGMFAGDQMDAMREDSPVSSFFGEIGGGITGTMTGGAMLGQAAKTVVNPRLAGILANPLTADIGYGTAYGAADGVANGEDPLYGAVTGGISALVGNRIGGQVAKRLPSLVGLGRPADSLGKGERAVYNAIDNTGPDIVADALLQAQELGVPASLADVSPDVNSLTGAALRRSPAAAGEAREALAERGRGQYDRFLGAVERDLGPIENIPQRSEDLIAQARSRADPLYTEAYAAPGAEDVLPSIADLLARPSMSRALPNARRIAAEEGRDPATLGFTLDADGGTVLSQVPSWQTLDYAKRGLDDVLEGYRDKTSQQLVLDTEGKAINDTRREFLGRVDEFNPAYAAARSAYAGPAAEREALQRGRDAVTMTPDQLSVNMGRASDAQRGQMQLGFQSGLAERAGQLRQNSNPFEGTLGTPAMERRLGAMYPDSETEIARLLAQRDMERQLAASSNRLVGNSMTAERGVADQAFGQQSLGGDIIQGALETAVTGAPVATVMRSAASRGLGTAIRDYRTLGFGKGAREMAEEIAPVSLDMDPTVALARVFDLGGRNSEYQEVLDALLASAQVRGGHVGAGIGGAINANVSR